MQPNKKILHTNPKISKNNIMDMRASLIVPTCLAQHFALIGEQCEYEPLPLTEKSVGRVVFRNHVYSWAIVNGNPNTLITRAGRRRKFKDVVAIVCDIQHASRGCSSCRLTIFGFSLCYVYYIFWTTWQWKIHLNTMFVIIVWKLMEIHISTIF